MSNCQSLFYRVKLLIWAVWTATLTRIVCFWSRIESQEIGALWFPDPLFGTLAFGLGSRVESTNRTEA